MAMVATALRRSRLRGWASAARRRRSVSVSPVFQRAQERVGVVKGTPSSRPHVAPLSQVCQRTERGRRTDLLVRAAVHHLQELYGELDVAEATRARA